MKILTFLFGKRDSGETSSEFSRFFTEASSGEKKKVYMDVARKASADQLRVIDDVRSTRPAN